ncbi:MAG: class I SAM-dependent methyltransferase, partial [bacterium]
MPRTKYKRNRAPIAADADRHQLYELAVQCVESEIDMVDQTYRDLRGRHATRLREDFCGTGNTSCEWVRRRRDNTAVGLDLDAEVLDWGRRNNVAKLSKAQQARVRLVQQDVLRGDVDAADIIVAMNFSYQLFKTRDQLRAYFRAAHDGLADDGVLMLDNYGGHDSWRETKEKT